MSRILFNGLILVLLLFSAKVNAKRLYFRDPLSLSYDSPLFNGLVLARPGITLNSDINQDRISDSSISAHFSFPIYYQNPDIKQGGWTFGLSGGRTHALVEEKILEPGMSFWELSFGRATYGVFGGKEEGYLGLFEVSLRDERPLGSERQDALYSLLGEEMEKHNYVVSIRMGATEHPFGKGLVKQKISKINTRLFFDLAYLYPSNLSRLKVKTEGFTKLIWNNLFIGLAGQWNYFNGKMTGLKALEVDHSFHLGPTLQFISEYASLSTFVRWNYFYVKSDKDYFDSSPDFNLNLFIGF